MCIASELPILERMVIPALRRAVDQGSPTVLNGEELIMDDRTFDGLARTVGEAVPSRRGVLRGLGGGVIAALLAQFGVEEAAAQCVSLGRRCK